MRAAGARLLAFCTGGYFDLYINTNDSTLQLNFGRHSPSAYCSTKLQAQLS